MPNEFQVQVQLQLQLLFFHSFLTVSYRSLFTSLETMNKNVPFTNMKMKSSKMLIFLDLPTCDNVANRKAYGVAPGGSALVPCHLVKIPFC
jgi:hypothetical protein